MKKICFIAPASNYHTIKWAKWFSFHGYEVHIISFVNAEIENVHVHFIDAGVKLNDSNFRKLKYLLYSKRIKKILDEIKPDIINAHYATSYGTVTALSGAKGYILSVWGSDVYDFPRKSIFHKILLKFSLNRAAHIFSTSNAMAEETRKYTKKHIDITPFGVDTKLFNPNKKKRTGEIIEPADGFFVGTIKSLSPKYGIDYLLKAIAIVKKEHPDIHLKLRIAGKGPQEEEYKKLARDLQIDGITTWLGFISQEEAAVEWANLDLGIVYSTMDSESFGVSAVEAQACETPLIISDVPGLMEATVPGKTSFVVKRKDENALADAIVMMYKNPSLRLKMGHLGRMYVLNNFEINKCFKRINTNLIEFSSPQSESGGGVQINIALFHPNKRTRQRVCITASEAVYVIGTVKSLEYVYGIDTLLKAVASIKHKHPELPINIRIAGKGSCDDKYKKMAYDFGLDDFTTWLGFISQNDAAREWASMDLAVLISRRESFGVSAVEAQACCTPIVISDVPGLMEATLPRQTSMVISKQSSDDLAGTIVEVLKDSQKRKQLGSSGRNYVLENYSINKCFERVETLFATYSSYSSNVNPFESISINDKYRGKRQ